MDTTFLVDFLRGSESARTKYCLLRDEVGRRGQLATSIITAYELEKGAKLSSNSNKDLGLVKALLTELRILIYDEKCVDLSSQIYSDLSKRGKLIGEFDILIASTCISAGESLVTNDVDFDKIPDLVKIHY